MNINRHNCEAWFLDFYEGQLSTDQVAELFAFLDAHPDLKEVFESYEGPAFDAAETNLPVFEHKDLLRRQIELPENINEVNYEEFFAAAIDNVLDAKGQIKLERFLESNPDKRSELDLFRKTILAPDYSEKFEAKHALKKPVVTAADFDNWAVAALEGTLSVEERAAFDAFLAAQPAYKAEFELFGKTVLRPDTEIVFAHKDSLRKQPLEITADNFAEYAVSAMDGELSQTELAAFNAYLAAHADAAAEYELYASTRLQPEADVVFEAKAGLKKAVAAINADNFAEYAVAALDHALSSTELESFNRFVAQHPEMAAELEAWKQTVLSPDASIVFEHKDALYQIAAAITAENFGEYAVAEIDGELSAADSAALQAYMAANPQAAAEMEAWRQTVLTADTAVVYDDKAGLKHKTGGAVVWWLNTNVRYAAAASVLLFVVTFWWMRGDNGSLEGNVAGKRTWHGIPAGKWSSVHSQHSTSSAQLRMHATYFVTLHNIMGGGEPDHIQTASQYSVVPPRAGRLQLSSIPREMMHTATGDSCLATCCLRTTVMTHTHPILHVAWTDNQLTELLDHGQRYQGLPKAECAGNPGRCGDGAAGMTMAQGGRQCGQRAPAAME